ncbi:MAG TPA: hypothetical protein VFM25_12140 [Verrucomicrobiae bacterium]|nr:hypothetical protein [Verrucomicrobiae bacterium]
MADVFRQATRLGMPHLLAALADKPKASKKVDWSDFLDRPRREGVVSSAADEIRAADRRR